MQLNSKIAAALLSIAPALLHAQFDFSLAGRPVQVHSFASQGFAYSSYNNYLTMRSNNGSFSFTDFGSNISTQITDKFRVGAQIYGRNVGHLGNWKPEIDWAAADYRFNDWFGMRAGKVKTVMGLYNDTQDVASLHTWALLPQSLYPVDRRGDTISHIGADVYGNVGLKKLGGLSYTVYAGQRPNDPNGGYMFSMNTSSPVFVNGVAVMQPVKTWHIDSYDGLVYGADLKWTTPVKGLLLGASYASFDITTKGNYLANNAPYRLVTNKDQMPGVALSYTLGNFRFDGEYRRELKITTYNNPNGTWKAPNPKDQRGGYVSAAYRFSKWFEAGAYHSRYYYNWSAIHSDPNNHVFSNALTARFDLNRYLGLKVEGHLMDGVLPSATTNRGFYVAMNPDGLRPTTKLLFVRLDYHM